MGPTATAVGPTSPEVCNAIDDDCDGAVDEGVLEMAWPDGDRDGWGDVPRDAQRRFPLHPTVVADAIAEALHLCPPSDDLVSNPDRVSTRTGAAPRMDLSLAR